MNPYINFKEEVKHALQNHLPVIAFESAVITHGLPRPENFEVALSLENIAQSHQVTPATTAIIDHKIHVGLTNQQLIDISNSENTHKISHRDIPIAIKNGWKGGTTVAATLMIAKMSGIHVFATGGIGGVHRGSQFDLSADLFELSRNPVVIVCAGAKSILDLPATLEVLETYGLPIIGYQTDEFPAFYSQSSGLPVNDTVDTPEEIAALYLCQKQLGIENAILVVNPVPENDAIPYQEMEEYIHVALIKAEKYNIHGPAITPFLLSEVASLSLGKTLKANLALLRNNAELASKIARAISVLLGTQKARMI
ncbi:MAG: pseudouridine-5-phosphate glycosidase [Chloroflexi bacterium HGW-Chloroflexi-10]|nr:MAG: pseudouridine-5-phosphate glycosidase [Chloroflexi bacterium HGW-Chloroflexi-10]